MFPFLGFSVQTHTGVTAIISQPCLVVYVDPVRQMSLQYLFYSLNQIIQAFHQLTFEQ